jgi:hypothetical protein
MRILLGTLSGLIGLVSVWGVFAYGRNRQDREEVDFDVGGELILTVIAYVVALVTLKKPPYQTTKTLLLILSIFCFCCSFLWLSGR